MINLVNKEWRKVAVTPWPKWQVVWKYWLRISISMFTARPGNIESLRIQLMSFEWNMVNPASPIWKGRVEDTRKSECLLVIRRIEISVIRQIAYSTGNGADFWLVLIIKKLENNFNQGRC
jgi:hypothetical protein